MKQLLSLLVLLVLLTGCITIGDDEEGSANEQDNDNTEHVQENTDREETDHNDEEADELEEDEREEEVGEPTFEDELRLFDVDTIYLELEEYGYDSDQQIAFEYNNILFVKADLVAEIAEVDIEYDNNSNYAEFFEGSGNVSFDTEYDEHGGILELGEAYLDWIDRYVTRSTDHPDEYNLIEYDGDLYVSYRLSSYFFSTPLRYNRQEKALTVNGALDTENVTSYWYEHRNSSISTDSAYVTHRGENYEEVILSVELNSARRELIIHGDHKLAKFEGVLYSVGQADKDIDVKILVTGVDDVERTLDEFTLEPGEVKDLELDLSGYNIVRFEGRTSVGGSQGENRLAIAGEVR
ncbi:hypothetical protein J2T56_002737 [Natronobacillus azotifigens]|uniref:Uncharacterized protein n=1 Tax=Natronobacillus azotifigens TaxID=472978 RepID=A0A9J6RAZ7_9BACI|nr:hypothetical protein [Natronobacillus azotifigens]MCZ0702850.1 hypothetical protein [Natronobacillus azotifigens]